MCYIDTGRRFIDVLVYTAYIKTCVSMTITYTNALVNDGYVSTVTNNNFSDGIIINKYNITGGTFDRILLYRSGGSGYTDMAYSYMAFGDLA